jgi:hypothetical protein
VALGLRKPILVKAPFFSATLLTRAAVIAICSMGVFACAAVDDITGSEDDEAIEGDDDGEDSFEGTSDELRASGACAGTPLDRAVQCAVNRGARILSYYRSPADQQRVRRENRCRNTCSGMQGCVRPTANCTTSPHTRCAAVDLVNDGAPATKAQLRACGLAKTSLPHRNHYDFVGR